jgi:hypothetical protein
LELPVLGKLTIGDKKNLFFNIGPSIGIGLGGNAKFELSSPGHGSVAFTEKIRFGDKPANYHLGEGQKIYYDNRIDFGFQAGSGVILRNKILIEIRYGYGLTNLNDKKANASISQNRALQLVVGMPINLSR